MPHISWSFAQVALQVPSAHTSPAPQVVPHAPQSAPSELVSTHLPLQYAMGAPPKHVVPHLLAAQLTPTVQTVPHAPQLAASVAVSMHRPSQSVVAPPQLAAHFPA